MTRKKVYALVLCLALLIAAVLPGTLAVSNDTADSAGSFTLDDQQPVEETPTEETEEEPPAEEMPADPEDPSENPPEDPDETPDETPAENPDETPADQPAPSHIDTCYDGCTDEACLCPCHTANAQESTDFSVLYDQLMAAQAADEFYALFNALTEEEVESFRLWLTENGFLEALEAHLNELEPVSEPADELPVVGFTNVGPLLAAPVVYARRPMRAAARAAADNGVVLNKTAVANADGTYTITLEAYATGESQTVVSTEPVDIVLVLDVSGSMDDPMYSYQEVYDLDKSKTYYIVGSDGAFKSVTWEKRYTAEDGWRHNFWDDSPIEPKTSANDADPSHVQFYEQIVTASSKMAALKSAVNSFIDSVNAKSAESSIAIVKFAGDTNNRIGNNTYEDGGWTYNYSQIVRNLTQVGDDVQGLKDAVNALSPAGATRADYGMVHAQSIINSASNDGRKKVVIMFTDGEPTSQSSFETDVANAAINASKSIKDAGATVYTIGVFSGANGTPVTSWNGVSNTNKYMHLVSSNYKDATSMTNTGTASYPDGGKSYFLSAGSSVELESIFTQISQEVGGSTVKLDNTSYIQDTVSGQFTMPDGALDVDFYTMNCVDKNQFDSTTKTPAAEVRGSVSNNTLTVTGFDFSANWCGPRDGKYSGKKLIIEFTVTGRDGFLGGNDVSTNEGQTDGIYNSEGASLGNFTSPSVNVPIKDVTVTAEDKNVYLKGEVTADQLKENAVVKVGDVTLNLKEENYGLESWQIEYVNVTAAITDAAGNPVTDFTDLTDDTTYTITVTVSPKSTGISADGTPATEKTGSGEGKINVFKPELTFKDSEAYYGADVPAFTDNLTDTTWKHGDTLASSVTMIGTAPELDLTYTPEADKIANGKINTKQDIAVDVAVKIGNTDVTNKTTFVHTKCAGDPACTDPENGKFWIHVKTCTLTITKTGGANDESYVFVVYKDGQPYSEVTVEGNGSQTIYELPVGTYTIVENTGWSWRYEANNGSGIELSADRPEGSITCTNTKTIDKWLNGFSTVVRNIFGFKH